MSSPIAATIRAQLGTKFEAMTGARDFVGTTTSLIFRLPRGAKGGINSIVIRLNRDDLYDILFNKRTNMGVNVTKVASCQAIPADRLAQVIGLYTGLAVSL